MELQDIIDENKKQSQINWWSIERQQAELGVELAKYSNRYLEVFDTERHLNKLKMEEKGRSEKAKALRSMNSKLCQEIAVPRTLGKSNPYYIIKAPKVDIDNDCMIDNELTNYKAPKGRSIKQHTNIVNLNKGLKYGR